MAKYVLNYTKAGFKTVNCAILDENCIANTYTVQFDNGVIKNVEKRRVRNLDHIDEAVLDKLKNFAKNLWDNIVKAGKYVYFSIKNRLVRANSPINTMIAAQTVDGLTFIPSSELADLAEEQGIEAQEIIDDTPEDKEFIKDANKFWKEVIKEYDKTESANEAVNAVYSKYEALNEARQDDIKLEHPVWRNISTAELFRKLLKQYSNYLNGAALNVNTVPIPYCIWGAPGIGKTQVIKKIIRLLRDEGVNANIIAINAMAMRKDDWALPGRKKNIKKVKTAEGKTVDLEMDMAAELPKEWLPAYDPNDVDEEEGVTLERLDDIANGGDGTGTGKGGFFFIDELSRIAPDVNNVIMTLLQSREFNGLVLGSKWMFVAAANRSTDMGENANNFRWDAAQTGRFSHVNLVPTFDEWCEWAESTFEMSDGTQRQHILPEIVAFLREHPHVWYNAAMRNKEDDKDKVSRTMYPGPRGWENASKEIYGELDANAEMRNNKNSIIAKVLKNAGIDPEDEPDMSPEQMTNILRQHVGNEAAKLFKGWAGFDAIFTNANAKEVWAKGDQAKIPFRPNSVTIKGAVDKILANHPNINKRVQVPGTGNTRVPLTGKDLENLVKYIIKCVDKVDERDGMAKDPILKAVQAQLVNALTTDPFRLDLINPASKDAQMFADAFELLNTRLGQSLDTLVDEA